MRTAIENYIIIRCKITYTSYFYSHIKAIIIKSQRIFNNELKFKAYKQQSEREDCSRLDAQGHQMKLLCHLSHMGKQI